MDCEGFADKDRDLLLIEGVAVRTAQINIVLARPQMKCFQLTYRPGIPSVHIDSGVLQLRVEFSRCQRFGA